MTSNNELPKAAKALIDTATANGWESKYAFSSDSSGNPFAIVLVGRARPLYEIKLTWHSRDTGGRTLRLFSKIWRHVPIEGRGFYWQDAPSLKGIDKTITDNPVKD